MRKSVLLEHAEDRELRRARRGRIAGVTLFARPQHVLLSLSGLVLPTDLIYPREVSFRRRQQPLPMPISRGFRDIPRFGGNDRLGLFRDLLVSKHRHTRLWSGVW